MKVNYHLFLISIILLYSSVYSQKFDITTDTYSIIVKETKLDSIKVSKIIFVSDNKKFNWNNPDSTVLYKDSILKVDFKLQLDNYQNEIIYKAIIEYIDFKSKKPKTIKITLLDDNDRKNPREESVQCYGTTKKGTRCQRITNSKSGYCWQHE